MRAVEMIGNGTGIISVAGHRALCGLCLAGDRLSLAQRHVLVITDASEIEPATPATREQGKQERKMVGAAGFEPTTSSTPRKRSTKLSHAPNHNEYYTHPAYKSQAIF